MTPKSRWKQSVWGAGCDDIPMSEREFQDFVLEAGLHGDPAPPACPNCGARARSTTRTTIDDASVPTPFGWPRVSRWWKWRHTDDCPAGG